MCKRFVVSIKWLLSSLRIRKARAEERADIMEKRRVASRLTKFIESIRYKIKDPRAAAIGLALMGIALKVLMRK